MKKLFVPILLTTIAYMSGCNGGSSGGGAPAGLKEIKINPVSAEKFSFEPDSGRSGKVEGRIEFTVTTNEGREYISGLTSDNFTYLERTYDPADTKPYQEEVEATQSSDVEVKPIEVAYLIDTSYSVVEAGADDDVIDQANNLAQNIKNAAAQTSSYVSYRQFSDRVGALRSGDGTTPFMFLDFDDTPGGGTALYQAMYTSLLDLIGKDQAQLFVFTDGRENASQPGYTLDSVIQVAKENDIKVHIAGLGSVDQEDLKLIATETGGSFSAAATVSQLSSAFAAVVRSIPVTYTANYKPTQRSGHIEFEFRVNFESAQDSIYDDFNVEEILGQ